VTGPPASAPSSEGTVASLNFTGELHLAVVGDVSDRRQVERIVNTVLARFGHVDILVSNAGITNRRAMLDVTMEEALRVIDGNLISA
jgi:3-oxoacyl-[acyl-carrier protein] reductase